MPNFGWDYPPGAANDPYAPYNAVECPEPDCEWEGPRTEIEDHLAEEHDIEPDWEAEAEAAEESRRDRAWPGEPW